MYLARHRLAMAAATATGAAAPGSASAGGGGDAEGGGIELIEAVVSTDPLRVAHLPQAAAAVAVAAARKAVPASPA